MRPESGRAPAVPVVRSAHGASSPGLGAIADRIVPSLVLCLASCLALASCGRKDEAPAYPFIADRPRVLFATAEGLSAAKPASSTAPASIARNASILTADRRSVLVAINSFGYARIEAEPEAADAESRRGAKARKSDRGRDGSGIAYRVANVCLASCLEGLTTGGIWPSERGFVLQLYRDPFLVPGAAERGEATTNDAEAETQRSADRGAVSRTRLIEIGTTDGERALPCPVVGEGFELFALFPSGGRWLGEARRDRSDSVELAFFEAEAPLGAGASRSVGREIFESALAPISIGRLGDPEGASLRAALEALGPGPIMARLRSAEGADAWYLSGGRAEDAAQAWAWDLGSGRVLALSATGTLAMAGTGPARTIRLGSPYPGASYTALASAGGIVAAAWEAGSFPEISAAGLVIAPLDP